MGWANATDMEDSEKNGKAAPGRRGARDASKSGAPATQDANNGGGADWAAGLKQLYDSVVEEPLPDSFKDLLSRLDEDRK